MKSKDQKPKGAISRRQFLKGLAAVATSSTYGCSIIKDKRGSKTIATSFENAKWIPASCWHNCGSRCLNKALVAGGSVLRQKTDDTHPDSPVYPQIRGCLRGRSQRRQVFAHDRLRYPLKRVNWAPKTGGNRALRGKDEWIRISWEEALDHIASEIKRVKESYGNRSIFLDSWTETNEYKRPLGLYGGYIHSWGTCSYGNWTLSPQQVGYSSSGGYSTCNDRFDYVNCETIIMLGCNPAWTSSGMAPNIFLNARKAGVKFIGVDPVYNESYAMLNAKWIPIRPGSDTALLIAIAHTLITEDDPENNPLIDWEFLKRTSIGFDADSMPEGEDPKGNFKDYVLGTYDNTPKDAQWASPHCGVSPEQIKKLTYKLGVRNKVALLSSWSVCRTYNSDNFPQLLMTIGAMTGHMGKSGHMTGVCCHSTSANHGYSLIRIGNSGTSQVANPVDEYINDPQVWDSILGRPYNSTGNGSHGVEWRPCELKTVDIRLIFNGAGNGMQSRQNITKAIEAYRKVEFVATATTFFTDVAKYADIILPVTTEWEQPGGVRWANRETILVNSQVIEPMYEAKSDRWISNEIGKRLGISEKEMYPISEKQELFNQLSGAKVISTEDTSSTKDSTLPKDHNDNFIPLCTITQDDISSWGVEGSPQSGEIPIDKLVEQGIYQVKRYVGDPFNYIAFKEFREDPEKNPRPYSKSGKFEIYSRQLADTINNMKYTEIMPIPTFIEPLKGYEKTFKDWNNKIKGEYPYQLVTARYAKRVHTTFDNIPVLSEAFAGRIFMNRSDADKEGIATGDTLLISSDTGKILRVVATTQRVMPGCVLMYQGSWSDHDEKSGIDLGGADNILSCNNATGQGTSGFNTQLIKVEKYSGKTLVHDKDKKLRVPIIKNI